MISMSTSHKYIKMFVLHRQADTYKQTIICFTIQVSRWSGKSRSRLSSFPTRTVEEDQQLPEVVSPSVSLCTSHRLQFPFALSPLVFDCSLLKPGRSLHPPPLIFHPAFLDSPCLFQLPTCDEIPVTGSRFATFQSTVQTWDWWHRARTYSTRGVLSSPSMVVSTTSTTTSASTPF